MSEYKRLTEWNGTSGDPNCSECEHCKECGDEWYCDDGESCYQEIFNRLAELEDKIEQGTLIELPCKVGDTVYFPVLGRWDCAEIDHIHITDKEIIFEWVQYDRGYELTEVWDNGEFTIDDIGKTVFLTREEAETKLKGLQNG